MSARRERPPSGKVHRGNNPPPNLSFDRPSTAYKSSSELNKNSNIQNQNNQTFSARERPQSGRQSARGNNLFNKERPATSSGIRRSDRSNPNETNGFASQSFDFAASNKNFETQVNDNTNINSGRSGRSESSELSTNEILRRMREKSDVAKNRIDFAAIEALGGYNVYSRPKNSMAMPLRTVLLDPDVNNFPRSKTRSELMRKIKASGIPHASYDLDMDGYVSQQDYKLAKRFDFDGNGVLDPDERHIGKQILADEFFKRHSHDLYNFGPSLAQNDHHKNVSKLVNSYSFERAYDKLIQVERKLVAESSKPIIECIEQSNISKDVLKHNYFTDKFDSTAWNDLEGIPRSASLGNFSNHGGSRKKLLFARSESLRTEMHDRMESKPFKTLLPVMYAKRVNMITDVNYENS